MFITALFAMARTWKPPKCPLTDKWTKVCVCVNIITPLLAIEKNEIMSPVATWMDLEFTILSEIGQAEKDKYYMVTLLCRVLKSDPTNLYMKQKQTHSERKQTYGHQRGK